eukprot:15325491-Ditylum_brightwellii.AAC.1
MLGLVALPDFISSVRRALVWSSSFGSGGDYEVDEVVVNVSCKEQRFHVDCCCRDHLGVRNDNVWTM